jgi:hypothetical protein
MRHIDIRNCFVTDWIAKEELTEEYCPTGDMVGDFSPSHCKAACSGSHEGLYITCLMIHVG